MGECDCSFVAEQADTSLAGQQAAWAARKAKSKKQKAQRGAKPKGHHQQAGGRAEGSWPH